MAQFGDFTVDRNSTKYVLGSGGDIISYATDEPAFEFNADGSYKGLLVEPAATNICKQSENLSTTWIPVNATPTQSTEETPDGDTTNKYIKLIDDSGGGTGVVAATQNFSGLTGGAKYTASVFAKADQLNWVAVQALGTDTATNSRQYFNLSTGAKGAPENLDDSQIVAYPNGWYRCSITWTQGAADTSFQLSIALASSISSITVDRDGTSSVFLWGAQVEASPIATSYIPTTTASVTRNKDDISLGSASSLIGQTEGTLYIEVDWRLTSGTYQVLLNASDGTAGNRFEIYNNVSPIEIIISGVSNSSTVASGSESSTSYSGIQKFAFAYKTDDFELYRNGSSAATDTSGSLAALATLTNIYIGQNVNANYQANMHIRAVALYPKRLSDAECEALTTL